MSARSSRRLLLFGALVCAALYAVWLLVPMVFGGDAPVWVRWGILGTPAMVIPPEGGWGFANTLLFLGVMLLAQWLFLRPVRSTALHGATAGRSRWPAIVAIGLVTTLLCTGLAATLLEVPDWWERVVSEDFLSVWVAMLVVWLCWSAVFYVYFRTGDFLARSEVVVRALLRGSCLELLVAIPTHAWVYRRNTDDCYCVRGSYTGIVFGVAVLLWAFGPGLVLLFLREKQRREPVLQNLCPQCGASRDSMAPPGTPCPQCGRIGVR